MPRTLPCAAFAALILVSSLSASHATTDGRGNTAERPHVGLVLGGGGAMGAAHIGVLKVL